MAAERASIYTRTSITVADVHVGQQTTGVKAADRTHGVKDRAAGKLRVRGVQIQGCKEVGLMKKTRCMHVVREERVYTAKLR